MKTALAALFGICLFAQPPIANPEALKFEVASIRPTDSGRQGGIVRPMPGNQRYLVTGIPVKLLMTVAYTVTDRQISGGPAWIETERFDIDAKAARPGTIDELHVMLQHLLEERFQLKLRHEKKELPIYELSIDKGGSKLPVHDPDDKDYPPMGPGRGGMRGTNVTVDYLAFTLSRLLDRNVVNKTGLPARYDVNLQFTLDRPAGPEKLPDGGTSTAPDGPTIFTALKEQLGLKLVPTRGPVDYLVIQSAQKPSEN